MREFQTWIKQSHPDTIKRDPAPPGYEIFHTHRLHDRIGGGVAFIAREELRARQFFLSNSYSSCDVLAVQLPSSSGRLNIITLYQPTTRSTDFYVELQDLLDEVSSLPGRSIICGDFNCLSLAASGLLDQDLVDILAMNDCQQHVGESTHRYGGLLDLLITTNNSSIITLTPTVNDLGVSDHFVVQSTLNISWNRPSVVKLQRRNLKSLNVEEFRSEQHLPMPKIYHKRVCGSVTKRCRRHPR